MMRIGDFSMLSRVSIKALRFYDEVGLLKPTFVDGATGYRYYSANLLPRLNRIMSLKELGFSLEEIDLLLQEELNPERVRKALQHKRMDLTRRIAQEKARLGQIESWLTQIEIDGCIPEYEITLRQVGPQLVASLRETLASYDEVTELFAEIERHLRRHKISGRRAALWHVCAGQGARIDCEAVVFLNRVLPEGKRIAVYELQAAVNACLIHEGTDETINKAYVAAHSWIKTNGYETDGPLCELYWQGGVAEHPGSGLTEIRYPIRKLLTNASAGH